MTIKMQRVLLETLEHIHQYEPCDTNHGCTQERNHPCTVQIPHIGGRAIPCITVHEINDGACITQEQTYTTPISVDRQVLGCHTYQCQQWYNEQPYDDMV